MSQKLVNAAQRGVSASKEDVHNAIKNIDKVFSKAFVKRFQLLNWRRGLLFSDAC